MDSGPLFEELYRVAGFQSYFTGRFSGIAQWLTWITAFGRYTATKPS